MIWQLIAAIAVQAAPPALPEWMTGCWETRDGNRSTRECWSAASGNTMRGESVASRGQTVVESEVMEIVHQETDDPAIPWMTFRATPAGSAATDFHWVASNEPGLTFVNAEHDYPQRIRYWRDGDFLMAEISLADGSKPRRWRYVRTP